ncbi:hypothetical protein A6A06_14645 [Streptomyces sp. CB02923]|nr:hypothetical protein A6A06_14645 [Streptomyces sp. CB02923]
MKFRGKTVLITGAGSGIGAACARRFAEHGARVVAADLNPDTARSVAEQQPNRIRALPLDVTDAHATYNAIEEISRQEGGLDIAVNNAGVIAEPSRVHETPLAHLHQVMDTNFFGVFHCMRAEIPPMLTAGGGVIVNLASFAATRAVPFAASYTASKHAVAGLTRAAAVDYADSGIRVVAVSPGVVDTAITSHLPQETVTSRLQQAVDAQAIKRAGKPAEVATLICFLASDDASFITGSCHSVDGGYTAT